MEERNLKVSFGKSGAGSISPKLSLPVTWLRMIGVTPEERNVKIMVNEETKQIIIEKE